MYLACRLALKVLPQLHMPPPHVSLKHEHAEDADDSGEGRRVIGLIAQEVQKVLPDVVYRDPVSGYLSVAYTVIRPITRQN